MQATMDHNTSSDLKGAAITFLGFIIYKITLSDVALLVTILVGVSNLIINYAKVKARIVDFINKRKIRK